MENRLGNGDYDNRMENKLINSMEIVNIYNGEIK